MLNQIIGQNYKYKFPHLQVFSMCSLVETLVFSFYLMTPYYVYNLFILLQPDKGAAIPKFGDWNESDPASADGFTHIFDKVREEKQGVAAKVPNMPNNSSYSNGHKQVNNDDSTVCFHHFDCS